MQKKIFENRTSLVLLHFLRDVIPFMDGCKQNGLVPKNAYLFYKDYSYPFKSQVIQSLKKLGFENISPIEDLPTILTKLQKTGSKNILIIEDGGVIVPKIMNINFKKLQKNILGAVEQTTKGIRNDKLVLPIPFPIISIPDSELKQKFEPIHVARAVMDNIRKMLPDKKFSGKSALVIGFGAIGKSVSRQLKDSLNMKVSVFDSSADSMVEASDEGFDTPETLKQAVDSKFLIIGCVGNQSLGRTEILALKHETYLVSASSEQWEFSIGELEDLCDSKDDLIVSDKKIGTTYKIRNSNVSVNLLADGYPINFWKTESMPNEVSDLIMSLIFASACYLSKNHSKLENDIDTNIVNTLSEKFEISRIYKDMHR